MNQQLLQLTLLHWSHSFSNSLICSTLECPNSIELNWFHRNDFNFINYFSWLQNVRQIVFYETYEIKMHEKTYQDILKWTSVIKSHLLGWNLYIYVSNKTVLLRERKRHTACCMWQAHDSVILGGGVPTLVGGVPTLVGGVPTLEGGTYSRWGGLPTLGGGGTYPRWGVPTLGWGGTYPRCRGYLP